MNTSIGTGGNARLTAMNAATAIPQVAISQNWSALSAGQHVTVTEQVGEPYQAVIDEMTEDKGVIWVLTEFTFLRRAFDYREGVVIAPA